jgi:non-ribosomal peptide synthetase component E (peptide arylation enzyme)
MGGGGGFSEQASMTVALGIPSILATFRQLIPPNYLVRYVSAGLRFTMGGMATIAGLFRSRLSRIAIEAPGRVPLTHARLSEHIETTADRLRSLGVGRGNRVVSVVPTGPEAASAIPAISSTATFVPLDPNATRSEYELLFRTLEPRIVIIEAGVTHPAADAARIGRTHPSAGGQVRKRSRCVYARRPNRVRPCSRN